MQVYKGLASLYEGINVGDIVEVKGTIAHYSKNGGTTYEITPTTVTKITDTELLTALEIINMVEICILTVKSAILRRESRGAHFRSDFPETNDEWKKSIIKPTMTGTVRCMVKD
mgnify:CR=1 FL=1